MDASGALDSLLGRLTTVLVNEAQLLGKVRSDVEFIKDEMESMKGLLLHLTEAQHRDHQVQAWMKQVVGLTRDCDGNVELYIHYVGSRPGDSGLLGYLRRIPWFLRTMPVRHGIATRIQELKVRARDVGDRRQRYGVIVPRAEPHQRQVVMAGKLPVPQPGQPEEEEDLRRRELLYGDPPDTIEEGTRCLWEQLKVINDEVGLEHNHKPICFSIVGHGAAGKTSIARKVYHHPSAVSSFKHRAWVDFGGAKRDPAEVVLDILKQTFLPPGLATLTNEESETRRDSFDKLKEYLQGKMCLIVLDAVPGFHSMFEDTPFYQVISRCASASTIIIYTGCERLPPCPELLGRNYVFSVTEDEETRSLFFRRKVFALANKFEPAGYVLRLCYPDGFALQMLLHLLYNNPNLSGEEILSSTDWNKNSIAKGMLMYCYNQMPINYKSCLLYLSIFPQDHIIRRTSLLRRWIAEGLITERTTTVTNKGRYTISTLHDQAEDTFDALVTHGFLQPCETSTSGKIRSCTMHHIVHEFITIDVSIVDISLSSHLAHRLSLNGGAIALQESSSSENGTAGNVIQTLLESMPQSPQWKLLKVLDLEGCTGLKNNKHLKNIAKILLLRYLSLRNTDVTELPKQIEKLQCLETLDIRQTEIRASSTKSIMLPMLKYFLAGHKISSSYISDSFQESFATAYIPSGIRRMKKLEVMSHVEVSRNADISQLLQLRKLSVVVLHDTDGVFNHLIPQINELQGCLRSLSIRINPSPVYARALSDLFNPPFLLESLNICGLKSGLPRWVAYLDRLSKITLQETSVGEDAIHLLGKLRLLRCLRLLHKSYTKSQLSFEADEFQRLRFLVIEGGNILNISFANGAAPKVELIVSSSGTLESLSGVNHLPKLKKLELKDNCRLDEIEAQLKDHPNQPVLINTKQM